MLSRKKSRRNPQLYVRYVVNGRRRYCGPLGSPTDPFSVEYARAALVDISGWRPASDVRLVVRCREHRPIRKRAAAY